MGKNSLVKSTSKKKAEEVKSDEAKVKAEAEEAVETKESPAPEEKPAAPPPAAEAPAEPEAQAPKAQAPEAPKPQAEPEPRVSVSYEPSADPAGGRSDDKVMTIGACVLIFLLVLVLGASYTNTRNFYLKPATQGVEIWQGSFAPKGEKLLLVLPEVSMPETLKDVYGKDDVYPLVFNHFVDKADGMLVVGGVPDFEGIRVELNSAMEFANKSEMRQSVLNRLTQIDMGILLYKAKVAQQRGTVKDLEAALIHLADAVVLDLDPRQIEVIEKSRVAVREQLAQAKAQEAEAEKATAEAAAAAATAAQEAEEAEAADASEEAEAGEAQQDD